MIALVLTFDLGCFRLYIYQTHIVCVWGGGFLVSIEKVLF